MLTMATRWPHSWVLTCAKLRGCPPDATNLPEARSLIILTTIYIAIYGSEVCW